MAFELDQELIIKRLATDGFVRQATEGWALYDFAVKGGAVGVINLGLMVPANVIVHEGFVWTQVAPTSGGSATVALRLNSGADTLGATAIGDLTLNSVTRITLTPRTTAETELKAVIATAALTAGKLLAYMRWAQVG